MLLIDVTFYFKCLQRYLNTDPVWSRVEWNTHTCIHASDRWPTHSVHNGLWFLKTQDMVGTAWMYLVIPPGPGSSTSVHVGDTRRLEPQLTAAWASCVGAVSLVFLRSISCREIRRDFRRISTPEEGMKGSGASAQGSAWGSALDVLPQHRFICTDKLFGMNHLSKL